MPSNPSTNTKSSNNSKSIPSHTPAPKPLNRQRRATTSSSSFIFAPSWLINLNNKTGPASTVLSPAYASTNDSKKEDRKSAILGKRDASSNKETSNGFQRTRSPPHTKSRDYPKSRRVSMVALGDNESATRTTHGRARSSSQATAPISSSPSSFDRNFPTLAKRKISLSVDLPPKNVENIWANSDAKSKLLSPTALTPTSEDDMSYNRAIDPNLERFKSLVPKVDTIKLDGKRGSKRKTSRSLSMDSVGGGATTSPTIVFRSNTTLSTSRNMPQTLRMQAKDNNNTTTTPTRPIAIQQSTRPRAVSAAAGNGIKRLSTSPTKMNVLNLSTRKLNGLGNGIVGSGGKYSSIWSNPAKMGRVGLFKMYEEGLSSDRKENGSMRVMDLKDLQKQTPTPPQEQQEKDQKEQKPSTTRPIPSHPPTTDPNIASSLPISASLEREEDFLRQLGWKKPYDEGDDSLWAITDEERRAFVRLVRTLNGAEESNKIQSDSEDTLSVGEIDQAKNKWASFMASKQQRDKGAGIFAGGNGKRHFFVEEQFKIEEENEEWDVDGGQSTTYNPLRQDINFSKRLDMLNVATSQVSNPSSNNFVLEKETDSDEADELFR
ncbi:3289_t:CDS:2 [Paraglomus brasilianum]|uniref:3289_t:CDS:1 n=1 Tax=Paraglomus brasilianum TaxID=144538 RepID=A0A9N9AYU6_9GLOM|nr:3289_t:CDS:2 [Paraglomus brasilianum]